MFTEKCRIVPLRWNYTPNQKLACFALYLIKAIICFKMSKYEISQFHIYMNEWMYLKIVNTFLKNNICMW